MKYYCTYFDKHYLSRGLSLFFSLQRHSDPFIFYILCLDDFVYDYLSIYKYDEIVPIRLKELEEADQALTDLKDLRRGADYLFTLTPCWGNFLMNRFPEIDLLTYLDSDLFFFKSPNAIFKEIGNASIAIIPHRFSSANYQLQQYGIFNVGWVSWRRDLNGLKCLKEYRQDCLQWCHDYIDGNRFADQRYLDRWPSIYPSVHVIQHPGANLAPWNLDTFPLCIDANGVTINGETLIFYHFHKYRQNSDGDFDPNYESYVHTPEQLNTDALDYIYQTYAKAMRQILRMKDVSQMTVGQGVRQPAHVPRYPYDDLPLVEALPCGWEDDQQQFPGWEIDSVLQTTADYHVKIQRRLNTTLPVISDLQRHSEIMVLGMTVAMVKAECLEPVRLLDWGGALGTSAIVLDMVMPKVRVDYHCADLPATTALGRKLNPERVSFHDVRKDQCSVFDQEYDVVYCGESLQYCKNWRLITGQLAKTAKRWLLFTRIPVVASVPSYVMAYRMFHTRLKTAALCWAINRYELLAELETWGFELVRELPYSSFPYIQKANEQAELQGYLFQRVAPK